MDDIIEASFSRHVFYPPNRVRIFIGLLSSKERLIRITILNTIVSRIKGITLIRLLWICSWHKIKIIIRSVYIIIIIVIVRYKIETFVGLTPRHIYAQHQEQDYDKP